MKPPVQIPNPPVHRLDDYSHAGIESLLDMAHELGLPPNLKVTTPE